jgi:hypothetical protein
LRGGEKFQGREIIKEMEKEIDDGHICPPKM